MPKATKTRNETPVPAPTSHGEATFRGYVYCPVPDEVDADLLTNWSSAIEIDALSVIMHFYDIGCKVTVKPSKLDAELIEVSAFDTREAVPTGGLILTAAAASLEMALLLLAYKHLVLLQGNWTTEKPAKKRVNKMV